MSPEGLEGLLERTARDLTRSLDAKLQGSMKEAVAALATDLQADLGALRGQQTRADGEFKEQRLRIETQRQVSRALSRFVLLRARSLTHFRSLELARALSRFLSLPSSLSLSLSLSLSRSLFGSLTLSLSHTLSLPLPFPPAPPRLPASGRWSI